MNKTSQLLCVHSALLFAVALGLGIFMIAGWLPPLRPDMGAAELQQLFIDNATAIRIGMVVTGVGTAFFWPFAAAIYGQMRRIEGEHHPMATTQFGAAAGGVVAVMVPAYLWLGMAYRPEALSPATVQMVSDACWLMFIGAFGPGLVQNLAIGFCILGDKSATPIYPRWVGYANLWIALTFFPGGLLPFFKTGPFAWNGVIGFWVVAIAFFGWILMMWWMTRKAVLEHPLCRRAPLSLRDGQYRYTGNWAFLFGIEANARNAT